MERKTILGSIYDCSSSGLYGLVGTVSSSSKSPLTSTEPRIPLYIGERKILGRGILVEVMPDGEHVFEIEKPSSVIRTRGRHDNYREHFVGGTAA